jgi:hypothetical protein
MSYRDINILLSRASSINDVFLLFARDFDLDTSKTIRVLMTLLKERSIKNESVENKCRENIEDNIESDESEKSHRSERSHRNHKNNENIKNRNQDI